MIVHGYKNKNHIFWEKISSHNYVVTIMCDVINDV